MHNCQAVSKNKQCRSQCSEVDSCTEDNQDWFLSIITVKEQIKKQLVSEIKLQKMHLEKFGT